MARDRSDNGGKAGTIDEGYAPEMSAREEKIAHTLFHLIKRILLIVVAVLTVGAAASEITQIWRSQTISLGDILLMFLYTEVVGLVTVVYTGKGEPFVYPVFIATTALARLIVLQSKEMAPENIVFEASAILLLAFAAWIMIRVSRL